MAETTAPAKQSTLRTGLIMLALGGVAGAAGFMVPLLMGDGMLGLGKAPNPTAEAPGEKTAFLEFGEVSVNLSEERLTRYLRVKIILVVDAAQEKNVEKLLQKDKAVLKNWVIGHLSDKSLEEVKGTAGVNRLRREIQDQFNSLLFADGSEKIRDVLFEEFLVQ